MCTATVELFSARSLGAVLFELCSHREDLAEKLVDHVEIVSPEELNGPRQGSVFSRCLEGFPNATHALVELDYFDADYRSNLSALVGMRHERSNLRTDRLVFLHLDARRPIRNASDVISTLVEGDAPEADDGPDADDANHDWKKTRRCLVLGYMVLTPDPSGPIGRSLIPPPERLPNVRPEVVMADHVRTLVTEQISVFGALHEVRGLPFIQQDGNLFSCAHAAAWMVHYAAVMRGLCSRRPTVDFFTAAAGGVLTTRSRPTVGLTAWQMATMLERFGLPPDSRDTLDLPLRPRLGAWYDREEIWRLGEELRAFTGLDTDRHLDHTRRLFEIVDAPGPTEEQQAAAERSKDEKAAAEELYARNERFWVREQLTRAVCHNLNSGLPSIVLRASHAIVIVGYLRRHDLAISTTSNGDPPVHETATDVVAFIVSDDTKGPCITEDVDRMVDRFLRRDSHSTLLMPSPHGIWMRGTDAEDGGTLTFASVVPDLAALLARGSSDDVIVSTDKAGMEQTLQVLERLAKWISSDDPADRNLAVRSYVVPGTDFTRGFAERRKDDPVAVEQVRLANLSRFVWVVEILDREARRKRAASVYGEVVFDATDTDKKEANALIVHLPGAIQVKGRVDTSEWHATGVTTLYGSGRYHGHSDWSTEVNATAQRWKHAR